MLTMLTWIAQKSGFDIKLALRRLITTLTHSVLHILSHISGIKLKKNLLLYWGKAKPCAMHRHKNRALCVMPPSLYSLGILTGLFLTSGACLWISFSNILYPLLLFV